MTEIEQLLRNWIEAPENGTSEDDIIDRAFGVHDEQYTPARFEAEPRDSLRKKLRVIPGGRPANGPARPTALPQ